MAFSTSMDADGTVGFAASHGKVGTKNPQAEAGGVTPGADEFGRQIDFKYPVRDVFGDDFRQIVFAKIRLHTYILAHVSPKPP